MEASLIIKKHKSKKQKDDNIPLENKLEPSKKDDDFFTFDFDVYYN